MGLKSLGGWGQAGIYSFSTHSCKFLTTL